MSFPISELKRIAIVQWAPGDGIAIPCQCELESLGYEVSAFLYDEPIPADADMVLSFAPYGPMRSLMRRLSQFPRDRRPFYAHWNFEGIPDPRIPSSLIRLLTTVRQWSEPNHDASPTMRWLQARPPLSLLANRMTKYRYLGDYLLAQRRGILDLFVESSYIYIEFFRRFGLQPVYVPWGSPAEWVVRHEMLWNGARDIDVLWMGKRRTPRRSMLVDRLRAQLESHGISMHVIDGEENPLVYGDERTQILRRSKIALHLLPVRHDNAFAMRFHVIAPAGCMVASETLPLHTPVYQAGFHYAEADVSELATMVVRYVRNDAERQRIAENAWCLVTGELTLRHAMAQLMQAANAKRMSQTKE